MAGVTVPHSVEGIRMEIPPGTTEKVAARAAANGKKFVAMPSPPPVEVRASASHNGAAAPSPVTAAPPRRRDPKRPGHFLDEAAKPALAEVLRPLGLNPPEFAAAQNQPQPQHSILDYIEKNPQAVKPAGRLGPYAKLGDKPVNDHPVTPARHPTAGTDAFLSEGALGALESLITAIVDARISQRAGNSDPAAQKRADQARAEFTANFVKQ